LRWTGSDGRFGGISSAEKKEIRVMGTGNWITETKGRSRTEFIVSELTRENGFRTEVKSGLDEVWSITVGGKKGDGSGIEEILRPGSALVHPKTV
jgi:hypothetical protein